MRLYELGNIYLPKQVPVTELPEERIQFTLGMYGEGDFFTMKGVIEEFLYKAGMKLKPQIEEPAEISVQVYDLNGKLLVSKNYGKCESGIIAIPISSLQPGNYLLNINKDGKSDVAKLIIK